MWRKVALGCIALPALLLAALAFYLWWSDFLTIDGCLDDGGRWNYEARVCEFG